MFDPMAAWTRKPPTSPGWYLWRENADEPWEVVQVVPMTFPTRPKNRLLMYRSTTDDGDLPLDLFGEWWPQAIETPPGSKLETDCERCEETLAHGEAVSCAFNTEVTYDDGSQLPPVPWYGRVEFLSKTEQRCPGCNVKPGGNHHVGCAQEVCPRCKHPLSSDACVCVLP